MKDTLISFETDKLAKEKGFTTHTVTTKFTNDYLLDGKNIMINETCILLWMCELQKWLREVHNIHITILRYKKGEYYLVSVVGNDENESPNDFTVKYKTYEEALEVGLMEALKLI